MTLIISLIIDILGILGAILVAIPFLNESSLKRVRSQLSTGIPIPGFERAQDKAKDVVADKLSQFNSSDRACVILGLGAIGLSYGLHMIAEVASHL